MVIKLQEENWDIFTAIIFSSIFVVATLLLEDMLLLRLALGIPFVFFIPGYLLTCLIWPRKHVKKSSETNEKKPIRRFPIKRLYKKEETEGNTTKTIDSMLRFILSVCLSLMSVSLITFLLNELYRVSPSFGLRLHSVLLFLFVFVSSVGFLAIIRKNKIPREDRFNPVLEIKPIFEDNIWDKIITSFLILMIIVAGGVAVYLYKNVNENEKFTEFFLLGPEKKTADYPDRIYKDEYNIMHIGLRNYEFSTETYSILIYLDKKVGEPERIEDFQFLKMDENSYYIKDFEIGHDERIIRPCSFRIDKPGLHNLHFKLLKDGEVYRSLVLRTQVFEKEDLIYLGGTSSHFYLAGMNGVPSSIPDKIDRDQPLNLEICYYNGGNETADVNITIYLYETDSWKELDPDTYTTTLNTTVGIYSIIHIIPDFEEKLRPVIYLVRGEYELKVSLNNNPHTTIVKKILVI